MNLNDLVCREQITAANDFPISGVPNVTWSAFQMFVSRKYSWKQRQKTEGTSSGSPTWQVKWGRRTGALRTHGKEKPRGATKTRDDFVHNVEFDLSIQSLVQFQAVERKAWGPNKEVNRHTKCLDIVIKPASSNLLVTKLSKCKKVQPPWKICIPC